MSAIIITTERLLTLEELLLDRLAQLATSPLIHKHRTCGVLAPNARLREAVTASAGPAGATLQLMQQARAEVGLPSADAPAPPINEAAAAAGGAPVRPHARARRLAGDGPDGGAGDGWE